MEFFKKYGNWRGNRKLPTSFILFFVLMFFLLGEQLIALPIYIIGPGADGEGPDKLHILDLHWKDALHRPLFYLLFGVLSWALFRLLSWPLVWVVAFAMWETLQLFSDSGNGVSPWEFIGVGIFVLVPYFIYRNVDRKWGVKGRRNAILILAAINILLFGFFAYQIYWLNNSYYGYFR